MTTSIPKSTGATVKGAIIIMSGLSILNAGCKKSDSSSSNASASYKETILVSDTSGYGASRIDPKLTNAWGMTVGSSGTFWLSSNHSGSTAVYDYNGAQILPAVNVPLGAATNGASPTGLVYNSTSDFVIPGSSAATYIYATEDGIISGWNTTTSATTATVATRASAGAVYKGLAMASDGGSNFLYATDFHNAKIDVFSSTFVYSSTRPFIDPNMPAGYAPFNIQNIGGQLYVTYAKQLAPANHDDQSGAGYGFVDVFTSAGVFVKRFASQGTLNSPWGIVQAPSAFGQGAGAILIGNFGDGHITEYNSDGIYQNQLLTSGVAVNIPGLWALQFSNVSPADPNALYFTAGPANENHGLFGYLKKN